MNRGTAASFAVLSAGVAVVCVGVSSYYFLSRVHDSLQRELTNITRLVADIRKDISELKANSKRNKGSLVAASSFSDDQTSDVYYDFSDEGSVGKVEIWPDMKQLSYTSDEDDELSSEVEIDADVKNDETSPPNSSHFVPDYSSPSSSRNLVKRINNSYKHNKSSRKSLLQRSLETIDELLESLSKKPDNYKYLHKKISSYYDKFSNRHEFLWRLCKACHSCGTIAGENGDQTEKKEFMQEALKHSTAALALTDNDANVHKWYAISIGSCCEYESIQNKIKFGFTFKKHAQMALQLNEDDESLYHLMGRWCYEVALMPWIERKIATTIFREVPNATLQEARNYFLTADKLNVREGIWKENSLFLAKTFISEKQYAQAIKVLDKAAEDHSRKPDDPMILKEIENLRTTYAAYRT